MTSEGRGKAIPGRADADYFENMNAIAVDFPGFEKFWTYTEMHHIVNAFCDEHGRDAIPDNFNIMFSDWSLFTGIPVNNPHGFNRFIVVPKDMTDKPQGFYCPGNCDVCKAHKRGCLGNEDVYCIEH